MGEFCACNCEKQERALRRQGHFFVCFEIQTMTACSGGNKTERAPSWEYDRSKKHESEHTKPTRATWVGDRCTDVRRRGASAKLANMHVPQRSQRNCRRPGAYGIGVTP